MTPPVNWFSKSLKSWSCRSWPNSFGMGPGGAESEKPLAKFNICMSRSYNFKPNHHKIDFRTCMSGTPVLRNN